ncbi:hypothetical protein [Methyloversatilis discipulorum]|uniref:hypothetical protein n=1 Tax=Methyloversatilis discipulorum TaxID=1119528 RepID=UPI001A366B7A|nr:hypothetical protein [Methyloversatilis discipulorum]MBL8466880.1 hypothetical protein [Methyloversatilis discipulorum]
MYEDPGERILRLEQAISKMAREISAQHGANVAARNALAAILQSLSMQPQVLQAVASQLERAYAQALGCAENEVYLEGYKGYMDLLELATKANANGPG